MVKFYNNFQQMWNVIPTNRYAFYVDYKVVCILSYNDKDDGDRHEFLKDYRLFLSRCENISWERIQIKLVDNVNGLVPISLVQDSLMELSAIDSENKLK